MKPFYLLFVFALSACASHGDLENRQPTIEYFSDKKPSDLASCISQEWIKTWNTTATSPFNKGFMVSIGNQFGGSPGVAWITPNESGSHLKMNSQFESFCPDNLCVPVNECK